MIISKYVDVFITNTVINYYRNKGYNITTNKIFKINVFDLPKSSHKLVLSKCDICNIENYVEYCAYNKSIENGSFFACKKCSHIKRRNTMLEKYGTLYTGNNEYLSEIKDKYDQITNKIEIDGFLLCNKCNINNNLSEYRISKNGRYGKTCRKCRNIDFLNYNNNLDKKVKKERDKKYYRDYIHINMWRSILKCALNRLGQVKKSKSIDLIGYDSSSLKTHLESLFDENMNWGNYASYWEIDHIIPVSFFKKDTNVNIVNSLDNLRPYNKVLNNTRGNKLDELGILLLDKYETYLLKEHINKYKK